MVSPCFYGGLSFVIYINLLYLYCAANRGFIREPPRAQAINPYLASRCKLLIQKMPIMFKHVMFNRLAKVWRAFLRLFFKRAEHLPGTGKGKEKVSEADLKISFN